MEVVYSRCAGLDVHKKPITQGLPDDEAAHFESQYG
jgi:hypothetical protein